MENMKPNLLLAFYGGSGIGLLFGIIMGTSTTPTVATVLGALTAVLAGVLGLNDKYFNNAKAVRIGSFGFACVIGAYMGLFVRSHNLLSPSPEALKEQYVQLGFSEERALELVLYKEFGFTIEEEAPSQTVTTVDNYEQANSDTNDNQKVPLTIASNFSDQVAKQHSSLLFSADVDISGCDELSDTDSSLPLNEVINNFEITGGLWQTIAIEVTGNIEQQMHRPVLLATKNAICKTSEASVAETDCSDINQVNTNTTYSELLNSYSGRSAVWHDLAHAINGISMQGAEKSRTLLLMKDTICSFEKLG